MCEIIDVCYVRSRRYSMFKTQAIGNASFPSYEKSFLSPTILKIKRKPRIVEGRKTFPLFICWALWQIKQCGWKISYFLHTFKYFTEHAYPLLALKYLFLDAFLTLYDNSSPISFALEIDKCLCFILPDGVRFFPELLLGNSF